MKTVHVVAAVICDSIHVKHKIYSTARGHGDYKGQWEFPGGKVEPGRFSCEHGICHKNPRVNCNDKTQNSTNNFR